MNLTMIANPSTTRRRIRVALDHEPGDLLITGGQVVNVFNRRVEPADVVIADGRIAGVGCYAVAGEPDHLGRRPGDLAGLDRCAHAPGEHALDPGRAGKAGRADGDDRGDLRLARGRQRHGRARDRHAGGGLRGAAARPVLHGIVVCAGDGVGRRGGSARPERGQDALVAPARPRSGRGDGYSGRPGGRARCAGEDRNGAGGPARGRRSRRRSVGTGVDRLRGRGHPL